ERGQHGQGSGRHGKSGEDTVLRVPPGTVVTDRDTREALGDLVRSGDRIVVAPGERGGRGNARFATSTNRAPLRADLRRPATGPRRGRTPAGPRRAAGSTSSSSCSPTWA